MKSDVAWRVHVLPKRAPARGGAARSLQLAFDFSPAAAERTLAELSIVPSEPAPTATTAEGPASVPYPLPAPPPVRVVRDAHEERLAHVATLVRSAAEVPLDIVLTDNRRTMISTRRNGSGLLVRLHRMFLHAGPTVLAALGRYLSRRDARASRLVGEFIESHRGLVRAAAPRLLRPTGHHHDLNELLRDVAEVDFGVSIDEVQITWGRKGPGRRRKRSIRLGTYTREERLIRVNPALDASWVPRFFVRYIVFHELLHHVEPEVEKNGRTEFHTPAFRAREQRYPEYARALAWERENLPRLLRSA